MPATPITPADVLAATGVSVPTEVIPLAWGSIETFTGRLLIGVDAVALTEDDELWVRRAVLYQAVWLNAQVDTFERVDVEMLTTDDTTVRPRDGYSFTLGPMARVALGNCSWSVAGSVGGPDGGAGAGRRSGTWSTAGAGYGRGPGDGYYDIRHKTEVPR